MTVSRDASSKRTFFLGALLSGALILAGFPPFNQTWTIWVAFIPVLLSLHLSPPPLPLKRVWWMGYAIGLIYFGGCFWWIGFVTVPGTIALVLYLSIYPAIWLCWAALIWRRKVPYTSGGNLLMALELANAWIILEWLRGTLFSGFGWDGLGIALHSVIPLLHGAQLGGVFLLSWLIMLMNVIGILTLIRFRHEIRRDQPMQAHLDFNAAMLLIALLFTFGIQDVFHSSKESKMELRLALIQPNINQTLVHPESTADVYAKEVELSRIAAASHPQLLLWPEATTGGEVLNDPQFFYAVRQVQAMGDFAFLLGSEDKRGRRYYNSAFYLPSIDDKPQIYDKNRLVPFGEFTPLTETFSWLEQFTPLGINFSPGTRTALFQLPNSDLTFAPLICFEDTLSEQVRRAASQEPDFLVNITNDGWFGSSPGAFHHLINAVFAAAETDLPLIRCANTGVSAVITPDGHIVSTIQSSGKLVGVSGVLTQTLRWSPHHETIYQRFGNWIVWLAMVVNLRLRIVDLWKWGRLIRRDKKPVANRP